MMGVMRRPPLLLSLLAVSAGVFVGCSDPAPTPPAPPPATRPASRAATAPVAETPKPLETYVDVLLADDPEFPTTRPSTLPLAGEESARLVFQEPLLLDAVGRLWITHPRGETPRQILAGDLTRQTYAVDRRVRFTWWKPGYEGRPTVEMVLDQPDGSGVVWAHDLGTADVPAAPDGRAYVWEDAFVYGDSLVVPTVGGVAVLTPKGRSDVEQYHRRYDRRDPSRRPDGAGTVEIQHVALADPRPDLPRTQIRLDGRGLIAWVPWESRKRPGGTIARFLDGRWTPLAPPTWADKPIHLMPLTDGNVLQLAVGEDGDAVLSAVPLDAVPVDEGRVSQLVDELSDSDPRAREKAFAALAEYGPGVWPTLERLAEQKPSFVRRQIDVLLGDKSRPTMGGLAPEPGPVEVREHLGDGGVILNFKNGILLPDSAGITLLQRPALLVVRPGRRTRLLDQPVAADVEADPDTRVFVWGDEWVVSRPGEPPKRWLVNHFEPLLAADRAAWQQLVGLDAMGRWAFQQGQGRPTLAEVTSPATRPTLVLDNRLPDPTPRLPVWLLPVGDKGTAGWDAEGWPVIKSGGTWRLKEEDWEPRPDDAPVLNDRIPQVLPGILPKPLERPEAAPPRGDDDKPFAVAADGTEYRGGVREIRIKRPGGAETTWPLPPQAAGSGVARGVVDAKGRLFLFNRPGRVVRIEPTQPGAAEPLRVVASFEDPQIPAATPRHVWIDPAGRLCALFFNDSVVVMWPDGRVPSSIRDKMPSQQRYDAPARIDPRQGI